MTTTTMTEPMSPPRRLPASGSLAVLVLLAAGWTARQVADVTTWNRRRVVELAELRGWCHDPDTDRVIVPRPARRDGCGADLEAELNRFLEELVSA